MAKSPYAGKPPNSWPAITRRLVRNHPLKLGELRDAALAAWGTLWHTSIGADKNSIRLSELRLPATVVGYFFEILLARELEGRFPKTWRGTQSKDEKDLVYLPDPLKSIEIKASGQAGFRVYGNRSFGQKAENETLVRKAKSGFYITVNFFRQSLTLLRFGWIDADDWSSQRSPTGQMSALKSYVYDHKLVSIPGAYRRSTPVALLDGVGPRTAEEFARLALHTVGDLLAFDGQMPDRLAKIVRLNDTLLSQCHDKF